MITAKRALLLLISMLLFVSLAGCGLISQTPERTVFNSPVSRTASPVITLLPTLSPNTSPSPSPTIEPATPSTEPEDTCEPEPSPTYDIPDIQSAGLSNEQYSKIDELLHGALSMNKYFTNTHEIKTNDMMCFAYYILGYYPGYIGIEFKDQYSSEQIANIINSAFGTQYKPQPGDNYDDLLVYTNRQFSYIWGAGDPLKYAKTHSINRLRNGRIQVNFDIYLFGVNLEGYLGKAKAILQQDDSSLYGFRLISLVKVNSKRPKFTNAKASSVLAPQGEKTFEPKHVCDGKTMTAWATTQGVGAWVMISSNSTQAISGMNIQVGDRSKDEDSIFISGQPGVVRIEFSDGTKFIEEICYAEFFDSNCCIFLGRTIRTKSIKVTILTLGDQATTNIVYISEISPF